MTLNMQAVSVYAPSIDELCVVFAPSPAALCIDASALCTTVGVDNSGGGRQTSRQSETRP